MSAITGIGNTSVQLNDNDVLRGVETQAHQAGPAELSALVQARDAAIPHSSPTSGAREATVDPAWAQYQQDLSEWERTKAEIDAAKASNKALDDELKPAQEALNALSVLLQRDEFDLVLTYDELTDLSRTGSAEMKAAASWLLAHNDVWHALPKKGTLVGGEGIDMRAAQTYLATQRAKVQQMESRRIEVPELPPKPTAPGVTPSSTPSSSSTGTSPSNGSSAADSIPKPPPSTKPGLEGATENLANAADHLQAQMMALAEEASKDPSKATMNAQKIAMLQNQLQAITNMMSQLQQMMSNLSKLWSEVAMNSIRNLK